MDGKVDKCLSGDFGTEMWEKFLLKAKFYMNLTQTFPINCPTMHCR